MKTLQTLRLLREYESRNVTYADPDGSWPIVWQRARGVHVWDVEGRRYTDLTSAFGVTATGHANPAVIQAAIRQLRTLPHAMGDVHPHPLKAELARELSRITFERWSVNKKGKRPAEGGKTILCNSGFEAVEAALKTIRLATGKPEIIAFEGAYHGLGYGALNATHREHFRGGFRDQLREFAHFAPFPRRTPTTTDPRGGPGAQSLRRHLTRLFRARPIGGVLVEPVQGRGGVRIPPAWFLPMLRELCDEHRVLLVLDEIYTGFGRTGRWFACEHSHTVPDLICLGKAMTGGFPLSACVGKARVMDKAWPKSTGEAIHTSTFLGHPVGCAMALAQIREIRLRHLVRISAVMGTYLAEALRRGSVGLEANRLAVRSLGLLGAIELRTDSGAPDTSRALAVVKMALQRGLIVLPEGEFSDVISLAPPLTITEKQLEAALLILWDCLRQCHQSATDKSSR